MTLETAVKELLKAYEREKEMQEAYEVGKEIQQAYETEKEIQKAYENGRADEREACAKLCEYYSQWHGELVTAAFLSAAEVIRLRGNHGQI